MTSHDHRLATGLTSLGARRRPARGARGRAVRPALDGLEDRRLPAAATWTGAVSELWSDPANWSDNVVPAAGDDVVFPAASSRFTVNNDRPAGIVYNSLQITGNLVSGYTLIGNGLGVGAGGITDGSTSFAHDKINLELELVAPAGAAGVPLTVLSEFPVLELNGRIRGVSGLQKFGPGLAQLNGDNIYTGATDIQAGALDVHSPTGLGTSDPSEVGTVVDPGGALWVSPTATGSMTIKEGLGLMGHGIATTVDQGALRVTSGTVTWAGQIQYAGSTSIGVDPFLPGSPLATLIVTGKMVGSPITDLTKVGLGILDLTASNPQSVNPITIAQGTVLAFDSGALGSAGTKVLPGGSLGLAMPAGSSLTEPLTLSGSGSVGQGALYNPDTLSRTVTGPITLDGDTLINVIGGTLTLGHSLSLSPQIGGTGRLAKTGAGTLVLNGLQAVGPTEVDAGTVLLLGASPSSAVTVNAGTFNGTGSMGPLIADGGVVSPAGAGTTVATLRPSGGVTLQAGSTYRVDILNSTPGVGYDQIIASGPVALDGATLDLNASLISTTAVGDVLTILQVTPGSGTISGTFQDLPNGATLKEGLATYRINYTSTAVTLTRLPPGGLPQLPDRSVTSPVAAGQVVVLTGRVVQPNPRAKFLLQVNWGDFSRVRTLRFPRRFNNKVIQLRHRYRSPGLYTIFLDWGDRDVQVANSAQLTVEVLPRGRRAAQARSS